MAARTLTWTFTTAVHGQSKTAPLDVRGFPGADVSLWRGKGTSAFGLTFEESSDQASWRLCAGADTARDPGADTEEALRLVFRLPHVRLSVEAEDMTSFWALGSFDPNPLFGGAPRGIETAAVDVGGRANNLALFEDSGTQYMFASLGEGGIAIVRVDDAASPGGLVHLATMDATTLAVIAGGSSDALAVVDGFLVSVAIGPGRVDVNGHGVTVFDAVQAVAIAEGGSPFDFSPAYVARVGDGVIAAPGNQDDKGGGVAGTSGRFLVATGGTDLGVATITVGAPSTYTVGTPIDLSSDMAHVIDVLATDTHAIVSGEKSGSPGYGVRTIVLDPTPSANGLVDLDGRFDYQGARAYTGPGNFACDLGLDTANDVLCVGGIDRIARFDVSDLDDIAALEPVLDAGVHVVGVHGAGDTLLAAGDFELRTYRKGGERFRPETRTPFGAPNSILAAVALPAAVGGGALVAAGSGGVRAVRFGSLA